MVLGSLTFEKDMEPIGRRWAAEADEADVVYWLRPRLARTAAIRAEVATLDADRLLVRQS